MFNIWLSQLGMMMDSGGGGGGGPRSLGSLLTESLKNGLSGTQPGSAESLRTERSARFSLSTGAPLSLPSDELSHPFESSGEGKKRGSRKRSRKVFSENVQLFETSGFRSLPTRKKRRVTVPYLVCTLSSFVFCFEIFFVDFVENILSILLENISIFNIINEKYIYLVCILLRFDFCFENFFVDFFENILSIIRKYIDI